MAYLLDQINIIQGKQLFLLLDCYSVVNKNNTYFQIGKINVLENLEETGLFVSSEVLTSIKNKDSTTPCYGIWQLLYLSKQISFEAERQLLVVYNDDQRDSGFFLYYCHKDRDYRSGLLIDNQFIGLFGIDLPTYNEVKVDDTLLVKNLNNDILRPLDRYKKGQHLFKMALTYGATTIASVVGVLWLLLSIILPNIPVSFSDTQNLSQEIEILEQQLKSSTLSLSILKKFTLSTQNSSRELHLLKPLFILNSLNVKFDLTANLQDKSGQLIFDKLYPWMFQLPTDLFQVIRAEEKIMVKWDQS